MIKPVESVNLGALPCIERRWDPHYMFVSLMPHLVDRARAAATDPSHKRHAYSYRKFLVGAAAFAVNPSTFESRIFTNGNLKRQPKSKVCAEKKVLNEAAKKGFEEAIGIVVVATTDKDEIFDVTGRHTPTLHCCDECRNYLSEHKLIRPDTLVASAGLDEDVYQVHTFEEMRNLYDRQLGISEQSRTVYGFDGWVPRVFAYTQLQAAENVVSLAERRAPAILARTALRMDLTA